MGSVCGILSKDKISPYTFKTIESQLSHRGEKVVEYYDSNLCFTSRKHNTGYKKQKHFSKQSIFVIIDGEIYNSHLLRAQFQRKNEKTETDSDEEIIIQAYLNYGEEFISILDGEFALALWDKEKNKLILVRDRIGVKPLYYHISDEGTILFASEPKAILQYPCFKREINNDALNYFFSFFYYAPGRETIFKGIKKLDPGHLLIYDKKGLRFKEYWKLNFYQRKDEEFFKKNFLKGLEDSIKKRMKLQTGVLLSGGIDSSAIIAATKDCTNEQITTFSAGFECENEFNELSYAQEVADYFKTKHYEITVKSEDIQKFSNIIWYLDDLNGSGSTAITAHKLLELANKKGCTQVFTGHEMELGTPEFAQVEYLTNISKKIPSQLRYFIFPDLLKGHPKINKALYIMRNSQDIGKVSSKLSSLFQEDEVRKILHTSQKPVYPLINGIFKNIKINSTFNKLRYIELKLNLPNFNLIRYDKLGMANSVEVKFPFLDHEFIEFSANIPINLSVRRNKEKIILKDSFANKLPSRILNRERHQGRPPLKLWVSEQKDYIFDNIVELSKRNYFKKEYIQYLMKNYLKDKNYLKIWALFSFEIWYKTFMEHD